MSCCNSDESTEPDGSAANPLVLYRGKTFVFTTTLTDRRTGRRIDLSLYTGRSMMRRNIDDPGTPLATLTVTTLDAVRGVAEVRLGATATRVGATPDIGPGMYVIDVEFERLNDPDDVLFGGLAWVQVRGEVTR